jgi:chromosome segregation ATPase
VIQELSDRRARLVGMVRDVTGIQQRHREGKDEIEALEEKLQKHKAALDKAKHAHAVLWEEEGRREAALKVEQEEATRKIKVAQQGVDACNVSLQSAIDTLERGVAKVEADLSAADARLAHRLEVEIPDVYTKERIAVEQKQAAALEAEVDALKEASAQVAREEEERLRSEERSTHAPHSTQAFPLIFCLYFWCFDSIFLVSLGVQAGVTDDQLVQVCFV